MWVMLVYRQECRMEPREECKEVTGPVKKGECRVNTRLDCQDVPRFDYS
jgi:hypothetical protein